MRGSLVGALGVVLLTGCAPDRGASRVQTGGRESITTVDQIDDQDFSDAVRRLTNSMLSRKDLFTKPDGSKPRIEISRVINNTADASIDTDLLVRQITSTLNESGKAVSLSSDFAAVQNQQRHDLVTGQPPIRVSDYVLSGKIIQRNAEAGDVRQSTFYFQLSLTDPNGVNVWENSLPVTKIGDHNAVGW